MIGFRKSHKLLQHKLFDPNPKQPMLGPLKKIHVPHFLGKEPKKGPASIFLGDFWIQKGVPNRPFWATEKFSLFLVSRPLMVLKRMVSAVLLSARFWGLKRRSSDESEETILKKNPTKCSLSCALEMTKGCSTIHQVRA